MNGRIPRTAAVLATATCIACAADWRELPPVDEAAFRAAHDAWRENRRLGLVTPPDGPLLYIGLWPLPEGRSAFGTDSSLAIVLPPGAAPALAGYLVRAGQQITLEPAPGVAFSHDGTPVTGFLELRSTPPAERTLVGLRSLGLRIHAVGERRWLRVWDEQHERRRTFTGAPAFPADERWRIAARLEQFDEPRHYEVPDVTGGIQRYTAPGRLAFRVGGQVYRLTPFAEPGGAEYFIMFADSTSAGETYPAGRYLYVPVADSAGWTAIDFNRAQNPPCAFTAYATCPLPPWENRLALAVRAGETRVH